MGTRLSVINKDGSEIKTLGYLGFLEVIRSGVLLQKLYKYNASNLWHNSLITFLDSLPYLTVTLHINCFFYLFHFNLEICITIADTI